MERRPPRIFVELQLLDETKASLYKLYELLFSNEL